MSFWGQVREIARIDLIIEGRSGEVLRIVVPFALMALLVFPLALGVELSSISPMPDFAVTSTHCRESTRPPGLSGELSRVAFSPSPSSPPCWSG